MHELSVCEALLEQVEQLAAEHGARQITLIKLRIGPLAGVVPELLQHAFSIARAGTVAEQATLEITDIPVRIRCRQCGTEADAAPNHLVCPTCGAWQTEVTSGDEMLLASLEMLTE